MFWSSLIACIEANHGMMDVILLPEAMVVTPALMAAMVVLVILVAAGVGYMMGYQRGYAEVMLIKSFQGTIFEILSSDVYHTNSNCAGLRKINKTTVVRRRRPCHFCLGMPGEE